MAVNIVDQQGNQHQLPSAKDVADAFVMQSSSNQAPPEGKNKVSDVYQPDESKAGALAPVNSLAVKQALTTTGNFDKTLLKKVYGATSEGGDASAQDLYGAVGTIYAVDSTKAKKDGDFLSPVAGNVKGITSDKTKSAITGSNLVVTEAELTPIKNDIQELKNGQGKFLGSSDVYATGTGTKIPTLTTDERIATKNPTVKDQWIVEHDETHAGKVSYYQIEAIDSTTHAITWGFMYTIDIDTSAYVPIDQGIAQAGKIMAVNAQGHVEDHFAEDLITLTAADGSITITPPPATGEGAHKEWKIKANVQGGVTDVRDGDVSVVSNGIAQIGTKLSKADVVDFRSVTPPAGDYLVGKAADAGVIKHFWDSYLPKVVNVDWTQN